MNILFLKDYKWLLSQNQRLRFDVFGFGRYKALAQHIKSFLENIKVKGRQLSWKNKYLICTNLVFLIFQKFCRKINQSLYFGNILHVLFNAYEETQFSKLYKEKVWKLQYFVYLPHKNEKVLHFDTFSRNMINNTV